MGVIMDLLTLLLEEGKEKVTKSYSDYVDTYDDTYSSSSERYKNMSDSQLEREIQRLKSMSGYDAKRMGKIAAMKEELESR